MKGQEQLHACKDPTERAVPRSEHLGSIQGHQLWVTGMGLTPCCRLLPTEGRPNPFPGVQGPSHRAAAQLLPHTGFSPPPGSLHASMPPGSGRPFFPFSVENSDNSRRLISSSPSLHGPPSLCPVSPRFSYLRCDFSSSYVMAIYFSWLVCQLGCELLEKRGLA